MTTMQQSKVDEFFSIYLKEAVEKFNSENPDYIAMTGTVEQERSLIIVDRTISQLAIDFKEKRILEMNTAGITHSSNWDENNALAQSS